MAQASVNERIKFLIDSLGVSARRFSEIVGEAYSNMNNYVSERQSMPPASLLEKILIHFENINPKWLVTGEGEPFTDATPLSLAKPNISGKKTTVNVAGDNNSEAIRKKYTIADCEKELDICKVQLDKAQREIELLTGQLELKDSIIKGKDEMLDLLRGGFNRPN